MGGRIVSGGKPGTAWRNLRQGRLRRPALRRAQWPTASAVYALLAVLLALAVPAFAQIPAITDTGEGSGTVRAVVIGIDNYKNPGTVPPLSGAVADARDIEHALRRMGAGDITLLLDDRANRRTLQAVLTNLVQRTGPRDLVIITFAGHGSQQPERRPGSEPDGKDEFFVLWGFGSKGADTRERFVDDEMFDWLGKLASTGARTLFLADVCHGGGLSKAPDMMAGRTRARYLHLAETAAEAGPGSYFIAAQDDELVLPPEIPPDDNATRTYPSLTFIAGTDDSSNVTEVNIAGEPTPRGATSYAFARGVEGGADLSGDRDGVTSRTEFMKFLSAEIGRLTRNRQSFVFEPRDLPSASFALFARRENKIAAIGGAGSTASSGLTTGAANALASGNAPTSSAGGAAAPSLKFVFADRATGNIVSRANGIVAYGLPPDELDKALERFEAQERFAERRREQPLTLSIKPALPSYVEGDRFTITASGVYGLHLIMINLTAGGRIEYLFPRGDVSSQQTADPAQFAIDVGPPFGSDAIILVATAGKRKQLEAELQGLDGKTAPLALWETVSRHLKAEDRLGIVTYKTRPRTVQSAN